MNLGTIGLLGLIQTAPLSGISEQDSLKILRDSVIETLEEKREIRRTKFFFPLSDNLVRIIPVICKEESYMIPNEREIYSAAICRSDSGNIAFAVSGGYNHGERTIRFIDWGRDGIVDFCYGIDSRENPQPLPRPLKKEICQPLYYPFTKKIHIEQKRKNLRRS